MVSAEMLRGLQKGRLKRLHGLGDMSFKAALFHLGVGDAAFRADTSTKFNSL
jgi:hypothetical protein